MVESKPGFALLFALVLATPIPFYTFFPNIVSNTMAVAESSVSSANEVHSDFNGDGFDDLAIGVPEEDLGTKTQVGAVHVLYGSSPSGLQTSSPADQFWHQNSPGVEDSEEFGDRFGSSLAAGDFNGDGYDDLAISAYNEDIGTVNSAGAVHVLYGSSSGLQTTSPADQFWHQNSPGVEDTAESDEFGSSLAAGDFNNDGFDELAIGVRFETFGGGICCVGAVHVLYGSSSGLQTTSPADQLWSQDSPGVEDSTDDNGLFGSSLAAGDFNNDGFDDLGIGASNEKVVAGFGEGAAHVLYGSSSGLQTSSPADQFWHQNSNSVKDSVEEPDGFGVSLAAGDFNNDGFCDLAIGVHEGIGDHNEAGAVNVLYGSASGLRASASGTTPDDQFWSQNSPGVNDAADESGEAFGHTLASGDFNNDGYSDLAIGVGEGFGDIYRAGAVHILYGSADGLQTSSPADQFWHQNSPGVEDTAEAGDQFGASLAAGDFNGDGKDDLAIGSFEDIGTACDEGAINVLYGSSSGLRTTSPADQFWSQNSPGVEDTAESRDFFGVPDFGGNCP